jgi:hypothetical protein
MKKSQTDRILNYLKHGNPVTPLGALNRFGCLALSQRIGDLKRRGVRIDREMVKRNGKRFASYKLAA